MHKPKVLRISFVLLLSLSMTYLTYNVFARSLAAVAPGLGTASSFAVLGAQLRLIQAPPSFMEISAFGPVFRSLAFLQELSFLQAQSTQVMRSRSRLRLMSLQHIMLSAANRAM